MTSNVLHCSALSCFHMKMFVAIFTVYLFSDKMPRVHGRKNGARRYDDCEDGAVDKAVHACKLGMKIRKAARTYDVPYGTLYNKFKAIHQGSYGRKRELPAKVEEDIVKVMDFCATMKAPIDGFDLRCVVQNLLNACNVNSKVFKDNETI